MDEPEGEVMDGVRAYKSEYLSDRVARVVDDELPELVARLDAAGYDGDYEILGAGQTAVIFFDPLTSRVLKVARSEESRFMLLDEYEFLTAMQGTSAAKLVPRVYDFDPVAGVLVREGIEGRPGGWGTRGLRDVYEEIVRVARLQEWSHPEYKEDSFIIRDDGSIVMVDVGFAGRFGQRLAAHIREALLSPMSIHRAQQFAYELRWEVGDKRLTKAEANELIRALSEKVGQGFDFAGLDGVDEQVRAYALQFLTAGLPAPGWVLDSQRGASGKGLEALEYVYISGYRPVPVGWTERFPAGTIVQVNAMGTRGVVRAPTALDPQVIQQLELTPVRPKSIGAFLWATLTDGKSIELVQLGGERAALIFRNPRRVWQLSWFEVGIGPTGHIEAAEPESLMWEAFGAGYRFISPGAIDDIMLSLAD